MADGVIMQNNLIVVFDSESQELKMTIGNRTLIFGGFVRCVEGDKYQAVVTDLGQFQLLKAFTDNILA